jgi:quercetin dioxygenase-like cupin family protein
VQEQPVENAGAAGAATFSRATGEGEARWWLGSLAVIKADSGQTGGQFTLVEVSENEGETPLHVHFNEDETFWVLEGALEFEVGGDTIAAGPGDMLFAPRGIPHRYVVRQGPARMLFLFTPGGFEDLLRASSEPAGAWRIPREGEHQMDFENLPEIVEQYGCRLLG